MKALLPCLALVPLLLTGCADTGYYNAYPDYYGYYGPAYYGPTVGIYSYDRGYYHHHYYHHGGGGYYHGHGSTHTTSRASVSGHSHSAGTGSHGGGHHR